MTTTVTKESLAARIAELESGARSLKEDYTLAAYKMLLATMESEPVAYIPESQLNLLERAVMVDADLSKVQRFDEIPLYRHAQPAPVVPGNCVTAEHRRVIEMLLSVCGAAFELADDSCQQDVDGEDCHVVPDDAFQKLSDALDEIENTLPTEDIGRPDVFLAWSAMPRTALKSLLQAQPAPDYFASLVAAARVRADKAIRKFPQPNYVLNKVAEESGEVIKAVIHYTEGREEWSNVEAEIIDNLAMLLRLVKEGDQVIGFTPPVSCRAAMLAAAPTK